MSSEKDDKVTKEDVEMTDDDVYTNELAVCLLNVILVDFSVRPGYFLQTCGWSEAKRRYFIMMIKLITKNETLYANPTIDNITKEIDGYIISKFNYGPIDRLDHSSIGKIIGYMCPITTYDKSVSNFIEFRVSTTESRQPFDDFQLYGFWCKKPVPEGLIERVKKNLRNMKPLLEPWKFKVYAKIGDSMYN